MTQVKLRFSDSKLRADVANLHFRDSKPRIRVALVEIPDSGVQTPFGI